MPSRNRRLLRHLVSAAALLTALALACCGGAGDYPGSGNAARPSSYFGWGSGWGGNRDWGGGWGAGGLPGDVGGQH